MDETEGVAEQGAPGETSEPLTSGVRVAGWVGAGLTALGLYGACGLVFQWAVTPPGEDRGLVLWIMGGMAAGLTSVGLVVGVLASARARCEYGVPGDVAFGITGALFAGMAGLVLLVGQLPTASAELRPLMTACSVPYLIVGSLAGTALLLRRLGARHGLFVGRVAAIFALGLCVIGTIPGVALLVVSHRCDRVGRAA